MTVPLAQKNLLLVEGVDDKWTIIELLAKHLVWTRGDEPFTVQDCGSVGELLNQNLIRTTMKASGLEALGVIADADVSIARRWQAVRDRFLDYYPALPAEIAPEGLLWREPNKVSLGVWIMPNNFGPGMIETFLGYMISDEGKPLWEWTTGASSDARRHGANFKSVHLDKVRMHMWLALQDPPGIRLNHAVKSRVLDPACSVATCL